MNRLLERGKKSRYLDKILVVLLVTTLKFLLIFDDKVILNLYCFDQFSFTAIKFIIRPAIEGSRWFLTY